MQKSGQVLEFPHEKSRKSSATLTARVSKDKKTAEIFVFGVIGHTFFDDGVTANDFRKELRSIGNVDTIDVRLNSDGGSVTEARAIYSLLLDHSATINMHIDGIAASAASFLAMAGDHITISEGAFMMIHNARVMMFGTAEELRREADVLDLANQTMRETYAARTGQKLGRIATLMDEETWFDGKQAVELGFADSLLENKQKAVASISAMSAMYSHIPNELKPGRKQAKDILNQLKDNRR